MARSRRHPPLHVYQNDQLVGHLHKESDGAVAFHYAQQWLDRPDAFPVSLSLPLREDAWRGEPVVAVFENLLPDSIDLRRHLAEKVGAAGVDAYSLLTEIGRDCIGALQLIADDAEKPDSLAAPSGEVLDEAAIERLLLSLAQAPLGLSRDDDFRISIAGAQEKTALLRLDDQWLKPHGATPTTHLFKPPIGKLKSGIDLSHSVENEYYCLRLLHHLGLPTNDARIMTFGQTRTLVIERFDRVWHHDRLVRLPQEDCCQALSVPPTRKYQNEGGPSIIDIANLLKGADAPAHDHRTLLQAQLAFWLIGATDGHAKNFSLFLRPGGRFTLTPLYDVMSTQPNLDAHQIERKHMKLAMSVGTHRHYRIDEIQPRHFLQTGTRANIPTTLVRRAIEDLVHQTDHALEAMEAELPADFPQTLHESISNGMRQRLRVLRRGWKEA